jgi:hypothetical protein
MPHGGFWYCQVAPSQVIGIWWHGFFQHSKSFFKNYFNLIHVANNVWIFDSYKNNCKNKTYLQMLHKWWKNEHVYVDHIHHPWSIWLRHDESYFAIKCWVGLHLCNQGNFSWKCWLQLFYSCNLKSQINIFLLVHMIAPLILKK